MIQTPTENCCQAPQLLKSPYNASVLPLCSPPLTPTLILPCSAFTFLPPAHLFPNLCTQHFSHLTISSEPMLLVFQTH